MKRTLLKFAALAAFLAVGGFLIAWAGLVPIAASSGHWPITNWFLHFTMRQSVQTYSLGIQAPALDDPTLALRGAGHFETGCAPCHGAPGRPQSVIVRHMTPHPPELPPRIAKWKPKELFWIVKHGVKFTGMPAWTAQKRDDEVWAMVAFLLKLPDLSPEEYRRLSHGEEGEGKAHARLRGLEDPLRDTLESCGRCHGDHGMGRGAGAFPRLAQQSEAYLLAALQAFAQAERFSGIMQPIAAGLSEKTMGELAAHYADLADPPALPALEADPQALQRGEEIAKRGIPRQGVPSCVHCHGPKETPRNPFYPKLAGQYADYLTLQLELFKDGRRGGTAYAHLMNTIAGRLTAEQIRAVALYYASLHSERSAR